MAIKRPDTPLAQTPIPRPLSDFSKEERKYMKNRPSRKVSNEELQYYSDLWGKSDAQKLYDKLSNPKKQ